MTSATAGLFTDITQEFSAAKLADKRLQRRIDTVMRGLSAKPGRSFPEAMGSEIALEGLYRLLNNPRMSHQQLLEAHTRRTAERARAVGEVLVVHDTSTFKPSHASVDEVGETNTGVAGFYGHVSLVLDEKASRCPLGVIALETIHRDPGRTKHALSGSECAKLEDKESDRWIEAVREARHHLVGVQVVHVMDREADSYALYHGQVKLGARFVIRADDRTCLFEGESISIRKALSRQQVVVEREVHLARRKNRTKAPKAQRPERDERMANLAISGCAVTLKRPNYLKDPVPKRLTLNAVRVFELNPPEGQPAVEWFLLTTEPIDTDEQLLRVVDIYRYRWVIEEFFKALKTGCLYQERQLESRDALLIALVLFFPIACQLLWLRSCSRTNPDAPAQGLVNEVQEQVIRHFGSRKLSASPSIRELVWAIAALGGHLKGNGEPGWQVLGRGWRRILELESGWRAAQQAERPQVQISKKI